MPEIISQKNAFIKFKIFMQFVQCSTSGELFIFFHNEQFADIQQLNLTKDSVEICKKAIKKINTIMPSWCVVFF